MDHVSADELLNTLEEQLNAVDCEGTFWAHEHLSNDIHPGFHVAGIGGLGLPLYDRDIQALKQVARPSPFGKGKTRNKAITRSIDLSDRRPGLLYIFNHTEKRNKELPRCVASIVRKLAVFPALDQDLRQLPIRLLIGLVNDVQRSLCSFLGSQVRCISTAEFGLHPLRSERSVIVRKFDRTKHSSVDSRLGQGQ